MDVQSAWSDRDFRGEPVRRTSPRHARALLLAVVILASPIPGSAQVGGVVLEVARRPVQGATIEVWRASQRVAAAVSDSAGRFHIALAPEAFPVTVSVRQLGLRTRVVDLPAPDATLTIQMEPQPVALNPLVVAPAVRRICPNREAPPARAAWERMRQLYWQEGMDTVLVLGLLEFRTGKGARSEVGSPDVGRSSAAWSYGAVSTSSSYYLPLTGYARAAGGSTGERTASWWYYPLEHGMQQNFTLGHFGAAHTLSIVSESAAGLVVGFCPRERLGAKGQIEGTLVIAPDGTLHSARWAYRTRPPVEDAGGEATYFPPDPRLGRALLSQDGLFWRRTTQGEYYFEHRAYTAWRLWDGREPR